MGEHTRTFRTPSFARCTPIASWCVNVQDDAEEAEWFDVRKPPSKLAFDHKIIVRTAFDHLLKQHAGTGEHSCSDVRLESRWLVSGDRTMQLSVEMKTDSAGRLENPCASRTADLRIFASLHDGHKHSSLQSEEYVPGRSSVRLLRVHGD